MHNEFWVSFSKLNRCGVVCIVVILIVIAIFAVVVVFVVVTDAVAIAGFW